MKAILKRTGEIVDVSPCTYSYNDMIVYSKDELDIINETDWQRFRIESAKSALQGLLSNPAWMQRKITFTWESLGANVDACAESLKRELSEDAVEFADALIDELKKKQS